MNKKSYICPTMVQFITNTKPTLYTTSIEKGEGAPSGVDAKEMQFNSNATEIQNDWGCSFQSND